MTLQEFKKKLMIKNYECWLGTSWVPDGLSFEGDPMIIRRQRVALKGRFTATLKNIDRVAEYLKKAGVRKFFASANPTNAKNGWGFEVIL